jgi:hypothetical protein
MSFGRRLIVTIVENESKGKFSVDPSYLDDILNRYYLLDS